MTTERRIMLTIQTSDDGKRCAPECPRYEEHLFENGSVAAATCDAFANEEVEWDDDGEPVRLPACIAASAAAVEAEVSAMREGFDIALDAADADGHGDHGGIDRRPAWAALDKAIEAKGGKS